MKAQLSEYSELKRATQTIVDMVDPPEEGTLVQRLWWSNFKKIPKVVGYLSDNTKLYVAQVLGLFKSYWPQANLVPLGEGMSECSEEKFSAFREEAKPIAEKIVKSSEQDEKS